MKEFYYERGLFKLLPDSLYQWTGSDTLAANGLLNGPGVAKEIKRATDKKL